MLLTGKKQQKILKVNKEFSYFSNAIIEKIMAFFVYALPLRNRIMAMSAPGIATRNSFDCKPQTFYQSIFSQRFYSVL